MLDSLVHLDEQIFLFFNGLHSSFSDTFMWLASGKLTWIPLYAMILYIIIRNYSWKRCVLIIIGLALVVTLADQLCASVLRPLFTRMRPSNTNNPFSALVHIVNDYRGGSYGFPSCHAANTLGVATFFWLTFRNRHVTVTLFIWAGLNCYSRVALGVHYPGDLLFGGIVGMTCGFSIYKLTQYALHINSIKNWMATPREKKVNPNWFDFIPLTFLALVTMFCIVGFLA